jgi:hypothetical protein
MQYDITTKDGRSFTIESENELSPDEIDEIVDGLPPAEEPAQPSLARTLAGMAIEIGGGAGGQAAAVASIPATAGLGYIGITFSSGFASSLLAQEVENPDGDFSWGRAIMAGALNMIPGSFLMKTGKAGAAVAGQAARALSDDAARIVAQEAMAQGAQAIGRRAVAGGLTATAYDVGSTGIDYALGEEVDPLTFSGVAFNFGAGALLGGGFEFGTQQAFKRIGQKIKGKSFDDAAKVLDDAVAKGDPDVALVLQGVQDDLAAIKNSIAPDAELSPYQMQIEHLDSILKKSATGGRRCRHTSQALAGEADCQSGVARAGVARCCATT